MSLERTASALQRLRAVLQRRPGTGLQDDSVAVAHWDGGLRMRVEHDGGASVVTDMSSELGGDGDGVTPGWLMRAGLASCAATSVLLAAAAQGVAPTRLEVVARSRSDARGLLGLCEAGGRPVESAPLAMRLEIRIAAPGVEPARLQALVDEALRGSPVPRTVLAETPLTWDLAIDAA
jgi:uncharacterized OsmC-like protein